LVLEVKPALGFAVLPFSTGSPFASRCFSELSGQLESSDWLIDRVPYEDAYVTGAVLIGFLSILLEVHFSQLVLVVSHAAFKHTQSTSTESYLASYSGRDI
jgi:hypothetical protein